MRSGEEAAVCDLVQEVFDRFVAPQFSQQGIDEFRDYIRPEAFAERVGQGHKVILAVEGDLLGMIEIREGKHISLLFVREAHQGRGIGRGLISQAFSHSDALDEASTPITVHASLNSAGFYGKMGFVAEGVETIENGIRYIPMRLDRYELG